MVQEWKGIIDQTEILRDLQNREKEREICNYYLGHNNCLGTGAAASVIIHVKLQVLYCWAMWHWDEGLVVSLAYLILMSH